MVQENTQSQCAGDQKGGVVSFLWCPLAGVMQTALIANRNPGPTSWGL